MIKAAQFCLIGPCDLAVVSSNVYIVQHLSCLSTPAQLGGGGVGVSGDSTYI